MQFIYYNTSTGSIRLLIDGVLRQFENMNAFFSVYSGEIAKLGKISFENDSDLTYQVINNAPLKEAFTGLFKVNGDAAVYLRDDLGTGKPYYRPFRDVWTLASYGFNLQLIQLLDHHPDSSEVGPIINIPSKTLFNNYLSPTSLSGNLANYVPQINQSGFTTILITGFGVVSDGTRSHLGDLSFGQDTDTPGQGMVLVRNGVFNPNNVPAVAAYEKNLEAIKLNGVKGSVNQLMLSIGGWDWAFSCVYGVLNPKPNGNGGYTFSNVDSLITNFKVLKENIPSIDGIDMDNEDLSPYTPIPGGNGKPQPVPPVPPEANKAMYEALFIKFVEIVAEAGFNVTFCPYENMDFWSHCLKNLNTNNQYPVSGYYLQTFAGKNPNITDPLSWLIPKLPQNDPKNPPLIPNGFIVPGFFSQTNPPTTPADITTNMDKWKKAGYALCGGSLYFEAHPHSMNFPDYSAVMEIVPSYPYCPGNS